MGCEPRIMDLTIDFQTQENHRFERVIVTKGVALEDLGISRFNGRVVCTKGRGEDRGTKLFYISQRYHFLFKTDFVANRQVEDT